MRFEGQAKRFTERSACAKDSDPLRGCRSAYRQRLTLTTADRQDRLWLSTAGVTARDDPCVDGSPLASLNSRVAMLVGAAMCPTC